MLTQLLGSKSAAEILLFILVNQTGYATQIAQNLFLALTPIQKGLDRLEKGGILTSFRAGRTKLYQLNTSYPLKSELERLLLRTYSLLPSEQKERYPVSENAPLKSHPQTPAILDTFWKKLKQVSLALVHTTPQNYRSEGTVQVIQLENTLIFKETGTWKHSKDRLTYTNTLRWTRHWGPNLLSLEHLRYGESHPVFLFYLIPQTARTLVSKAVHLCQDDTYFGKLCIEGNNLKLIWQTIGPSKRETIESIYSP